MPAADPDAVHDVHVVVDRPKDPDGDERADRHDRLRDEVTALRLLKDREHDEPDSRDDPDEQDAAERRGALLRQVRLRTLSADLRPHPEPAHEIDVRPAEHEAEEERGEQYRKRQDRHLVPRPGRRVMTERADEGDDGVGGAGPMELRATSGTRH